jgi:hypothetical protein
MSDPAMVVLHDWELDLCVDDVLRAQGADPAVVRARRPKLVSIAEAALQEGTPLMEPVVIFRQFDVESFRHETLHLAGGHALSGELIAQHLAPATKVVVAVCSVGKRLEEYASSVVTSSTIQGLALDGVGSAAAEALATEACRHFEKSAAKENLEISLPLNPGMKGWPLAEGQPQIFAALDTAQVDITLRPNLLIQPRKSLSMVLGLGPNINRGGRICDYCSMQETCRYQNHGD